jgi:phage shock protein PspC (stress-responsive transcriptional regulator)
MNEVTTIHLGRQAFIISAGAQKQLRAYLEAIEKQVGDKDVAEEIEMRMAELLAENGIKGEKVVLPKDVDFLKEQLGDPREFNGEDEHDTKSVPLSDDPKRLFRDTEKGILAGVAAGLAAYFGVDVIIIRLLFVVGTIAWGGGILLYVLLWLLVPEAKSPSEKLQMAGKSVNVESLKEIVERADVKGAAKRANGTITPFINSFFRVIFKIIGIGFILGGMGAILALSAIWTYMTAHHGQLFQENLFPVGTAEHVLTGIGAGLGIIVSIFAILCGLAMFKRRWPIPGWSTGILAGIFLVGATAAIVLSADAAPKVRDRYLSQSHTQTRSLQPFQDVTIVGKDVDYQWEYADSYSVSFHYFDNPDISNIKTTVSNDVLTIDTRNYQRDRDCQMLCLFRAYNLLITVKGPKPLSVPSPADKPTHLIPAPYQT